MAEVISQGQSVEIGTELISVLRGWHRLERARDENARIIDFDFAPPLDGVPQFRDRAEVIDRLYSIEESIDPNASPVDEFTHAKAVSMLAYAEALDGKEFEFHDYVEKTVGVRPSQVPLDVIQRQYDLTADLFRAVNPGLTFTPEGWRTFLKDGKVSKEEIRDTMIDAKSRIEPIVMATIGRQFQTNSEPEFVDLDFPWMSRIYGDNNGIHFEVNLHEKVIPKWYKGRPEQTASHERGAHYVQGVCIRENIENGVIPPILGLTTLPGPEQVVDEGIADALPYLIPEIYTILFEYGQMAVELKYLEDLVHNNVHIMVNTGVSVWEARQFDMHYLPNETEPLFNDRLVHRTKPKYRGYWPAYYEGARYFHDLAADLSSSQMASVLEYAYNRSLTFPQMKRFVDGLQSPEALSA